jgi:hypothetical protein
MSTHNSILSSTLGELIVLFYIPTGDGVLGKEIKSENFHYSITPTLPSL